MSRAHIRLRPHDEHDFDRTMQVSMDGTVVLLTTESQRVETRLIVPSEHDAVEGEELHNDRAETMTRVDEPRERVHASLQRANVIHLRQHHIHSSLLHPQASSLNASTQQCFVSCPDLPVQLRDCTNGSVLSAYAIIDSQERFRPAASLVSSTHQLFAGHQRAIEVFDVESGESSRMRLSDRHTTVVGQKGIVSTMALDQCQPACLVAGTWLSQLALYDTRELCAVQQFGAPEMRFRGCTQVEFHPFQPHLVLAAHRPTQEIEVWDVRSMADSLGIIARPGKTTNQRLGFQVVGSENEHASTLLTGSQDGQELRIGLDLSDGFQSKIPVSLKLAETSVNNIYEHPWLPWTLYTAGEREKVE